VVRSDFPLSKRIDSNAYVDRLTNGVDIDRCLSGSRDRQVPGTAESRFDLHDRSTNADLVEQFTSPWHGDGGKYAQDADCDDELDDCESVPHQCLSFRRVNWLDSI
jgi:hypothetical protein